MFRYTQYSVGVLLGLRLALTTTLGASRLLLPSFFLLSPQTNKKPTRRQPLRKQGGSRFERVPGVLRRKSSLGRYLGLEIVSKGTMSALGGCFRASARAVFLPLGATCP